MKDIWKQFAADFNSLTDEQIETEVNESQAKVDQHQDWLDAVASWKAAGKPREPLDLVDV